MMRGLWVWFLDVWLIAVPGILLVILQWPFRKIADLLDRPINALMVIADKRHAKVVRGNR